MHFGLSEATINVVLHGNLDEFGKLFSTLLIRGHMGFGGAVVKPGPKK